jgi:hypothetical protein
MILSIALCSNGFHRVPSYKVKLLNKYRKNEEIRIDSNGFIIKTTKNDVNSASTNKNFSKLLSDLQFTIGFVSDNLNPVLLHHCDYEIDDSVSSRVRKHSEQNYRILVESTCINRL